MRFVVIGGDAAGMSAASKAKRNQGSLETIVLEATNDVSYSACGMPYNIGSPGRVMDDLIVRRAEVFREKQGIDLKLGHRAAGIDRTSKTVSGVTSNGEKFELSYDKLLIATGARSRLLNVPGNTLQGVKTLKTLEDGRNIKDFTAANNVKNVLIVGMGYIGLEMAEGFHERGISVHMVKPSPRLLPWMPDEMADEVRKELTEKGISLETNVTPKAFEAYGKRIRAVFESGEKIYDMVLVSIGIVPNSKIAAQAGLQLGPSNSVAVDKMLQTSDVDIYAAGDCADSFHVTTGQRVWIPLALRANRAGWAVADNVCGRNVELDGVVGTAVFKVLDLETGRTGLSFDEASRAGFEPVQTYVKSRSRAHAHPGNVSIHVNLVADKKSGKLLGGCLLGKEGAAHRIDAVAVALHAGMTVEQFFQCDLAYAPPFSPVWDPLLTAANQLLKNF